MENKFRLVGVIPGKPFLVANLAQQDGLKIPLLCDPEYLWHEWLGLGRFGLANFLKPNAIFGYIKGLLKGRSIAKSGENADLMRQGGEVFLAGNGKPLWVHRSVGPTDRPSTSDLARVLKQIH